MSEGHVISRRRMLRTTMHATLVAAGARTLFGMPQLLAHAEAAQTSLATPTYLGGHSVEFLIDGVSVYKRIHELLDELAAVPATQGAYLHIALWMCDASTHLLGLPSQLDEFSFKITQVAAAGHEVKLLLWQPITTLQFVSEFTSGSLRQSLRNTALGDVRQINENMQQIVDGVPHIQVELLQHPDWTGSYHDKLFIFSAGDAVQVIVGGLNMAPAYRGAFPYTAVNWHDAAVQFAGPATAEVEQEFARLWALTPGSPPATSPVPAARGTQSIQVAATSPKTKTSAAKREIYTELAARVAAAEEYVYLENFAIHDPDLITAIGAKISAMKEQGRPFEVILVVPDVEDALYGWLHSVTYKHLAFMACDKVFYKFKSFGVPPMEDYLVRKRDGIRKWGFAYRGDWYEDSVISWDGGEMPIKDITGFSPDFRLYTPIVRLGGGRNSYVYVHAKVSIFDDRFAGVGSANFNTRSMQQDGEVTAFVSGDSVRTFRQQIWGIWFQSTGPVPGAAGWRAAAEHHLKLAKSGAATVGRVYMLPVDPAWYPSQKPHDAPLGAARYY